MRHLQVIIIMVCFLFSKTIYSQCGKYSFSKIYELRAKYIEESVPDKFYFDYSFFNKIDRKTIIDSLSCILLDKQLKLEYNCYIVEFQHEDNKDILFGVFWSGEIVISYVWDNFNKEIKIKKREFLSKVIRIKEDVENWNDYISNTSYVRTFFSGGVLFFCSSIKLKRGRFNIKNAVFKEYDKNHFERFLKETRENDYETIIIPN
jgi:hypothetical protein